MAVILAYLCLSVVVMLLVLLTFLLSYSVVAHRYWKSNGVFSLEPQLFFGNAKSVVLQKEGMGMGMKHFYDTLKRNGLAFGGYYFLTRPILVLADMKLIKDVLTTDFSHFVDHPFYIDEEKDPLSANLYSLQGEKWKTRRSKLAPAFSAGRLKIMFETIAKCCNQLTVVIDESAGRGNAIDIMDIIANMGVDMIGSCAFGLDCNSFKNTNNKFKHFGLQFLHNTSKWRAFVFMLLFMFPDLSKKLKLTLNNKEMTDFFLQLVRDVAQHREENNISRKDFMHSLLQIKNNVEISETSLGSVMPSVRQEEDGATIAEIAGHCFSFFVAGFEPFSTTTSFCLYELSLNTTLQDNLRKEINSVLDAHEGKLTYDAVMDMGLLDRCLKETLRKHSPATSHIRLCTKPYKIPNSNLTLPIGTTVLIPAYGLHMDPEYYPNPEIFDPDRFSEENLAKRPAESWMPFGLGPRQCVSYLFGLLEMKAGLVTLLKRYRFSLHPSTKTPITMCPKNPVMYPSSTIYLSAEKISII
ncbi:hypothetical protein PPYR_01525 [Photinus pyralis]|uniref:Cytochrome P450 n=1 Tax=Photinus pyralis TaxID=7054 RepID=A0A5N4B4N0_PHOPY|nr:probable cytochrome P450 6a23 [Photinus pyralis]KAB0804555.1 hypothetical protein PPYR_01525 [Photinus pyralis]